MKISIENETIKVGDSFFIGLDGNDLTEEKLLTLFASIEKKQEVEIDDKIKLQSDDRKKCEMLKLLIDEYMNSYFKEATNDDENKETTITEINLTDEGMGI